jgi:hypothetical protein
MSGLSSNDIKRRRGHVLVNTEVGPLLDVARAFMVLEYD